MVEIETVAVERVLQCLAADGSVERERVLSEKETSIGRTAVDFACPDDLDMAERHAQLSVENDTVVISDSGEGSGVWLRIAGSEGRLLRSGDQLWLGAQILVLRVEEKHWQIRHHGPDGRLRETVSLPTAGLFIGRASDLILDPDDSRLSRRHAQLMPEGDDLRLFDRGAQNGTYLKLLTAEPLSNGDEFRLAKNRFRYLERPLPMIEEPTPEPVESPDPSEAITGDATIVSPTAKRAEVESSAPEVPEPSPIPTAEDEDLRRPRGLAARLRKLGRRSEKEAVASAPERLEAEAPTIVQPRIEGRAEQEEGPTSDLEAVDAESAAIGKAEKPEVDANAEQVLLVIDTDEGSVSLEVAAGKTVLEAVQEAGLARGEPIDWECGDGACGVCVVGVVEGADRMDPPDAATGEMKTIQITEQVVPDPQKYRLACLARLRGTVRLRKLS